MHAHTVTGDLRRGRTSLGIRSEGDGRECLTLYFKSHISREAQYSPVAADITVVASLDNLYLAFHLFLCFFFLTLHPRWDVS